MSDVYYNLNDNLLEVVVSRKDENGDIVYDTGGDAVVTVTVNNPSGTPLSGQSWPLTLNFVAASNGVFNGTLEDTLVTTGLTYGIAVITTVWEGLTSVISCQVPFEDRLCCPEIPTAPDPEDDTPATSIDIINAANMPAQTTGDEGSVRERPISELIEADRYQRSLNAGSGGPPYGMRVARIRPGGTVER